MGSAAYYDQTSQLNLALQRVAEVGEKHILAAQPFLEMVQKESALNPTSMQFADNKFIMPEISAFPASFRGVATKTTVPSAKTSVPILMTASLKKSMGIVEIPWETKVLGTAEAFALKIVSMAKRHIMVSAKDRTNVQLFGGEPDGAYLGALAKIYSNNGANPSVLVLYRHDGANSNALAGAVGNKYLQPGMDVIIDAAASIAASNNVTTIASKNKSADSVILGGQVAGIAQGDYIFAGENDGTVNTHAYGNVPTGLAHHINDSAPATYQGLTRSSYEIIQANVFGNSGTSRALTTNLIQRCLDAAEEFTFAQHKTNLVIMSYGMRRDYSDLYDDKVRFSPKDILKGPDHTTARFPNGVLPLAEPYCQPGRIYFTSTDSFTLGYGEKLFQFEQGDIDGVLLRYGTSFDKDIYQIRVRALWQLMCDMPRANTLLKDLVDVP